MPEIKRKDMKPGVVYYGVQGSLGKIFNFTKFFTSEQESDTFVNEAVRKYSPLYRPGSGLSVKGTCVRTYISKHRAMIGE
jgi:hypothetical protein